MVIALLLLIGGMGCAMEKENDIIFPVKNLSEQISLFFDTHLPITSESTCFFKLSNEEDHFYLINSIEELQAVYSCEEKLPELDFKKYSVVIGQKRMPNSYYIVSDQNIVVQAKNLKLNIIAKTYSEGVWPSFSMMYYWGVYPKLPNLKLNVNIEIK